MNTQPKSGISASNHRLPRLPWRAAAFALSLAGFLVLAYQVHTDAFSAWDVSVADFIQSRSFPGLFETMLVISALGRGWVPFALTGATGVLLWKTGLRAESLICLAGVGTAALANPLIKIVVARPRPVDRVLEMVTKPASPSFPSGHVLFFVTFFGFLAVLALSLMAPGTVRRSIVVLCVSLTGAVGVSRVYLGVHWPSDILGGYLLGTLWLGLMGSSYRRLKARSRKRGQEEARARSRRRFSGKPN